MRWEDERYVRVYTRDTVDWLALSFDAQALFLLLLRKVDRAGLLDLGRAGKRGVAVAVGHPRDWSRLEPALEELLADGCVRLTEDGGRLLVPNFLTAQEAKASDRARQQKSRETARDVAAMQNASPRDESSHGVTDSHVSGQSITPSHAASRDVTPSRAVLSHAVSVTATQGPADAVPTSEHEDLPGATEDATPVGPAPNGCPDCTDRAPCWVHLRDAVPAKSPKPPRQPSKAEAAYGKFQEARQRACEAAGVAFVPDRWHAARINKDLGAILRGGEEEQGRFVATFEEYLGDESMAEKGWSLSYLMSGGVRSKYEQRALRGAA